MTPWLKHEALSDPVVVRKKVQPSCTHIRSLKLWTSFYHKTYGITAGMGIDAFENVAHFEKAKDIFFATFSRPQKAKEEY
jgi:hypothetical protein